MIHHYVFGEIPRVEAQQLDGKVVTIDTWADAEWEQPEKHYPHVRVMAWNGPSLFVLADDQPGPADEIPLHLIRTVEVHPS